MCALGMCTRLGNTCAKALVAEQIHNLAKDMAVNASPAGRGLSIVALQLLAVAGRLRCAWKTQLLVSDVHERADFDVP